ncbi:MAG: hypothetical protein ACLP0J_00345 [Solirubrobacteraceae bacterium]
MLDTPLAELMESDEDRAQAEELTREALVVPAMLRLGKLVAFVGDGRPATPAGNLKAPDAVALARLLRADVDVPGAVRSMDDLPDVAHVFRWAIAAELLTARKTKIVSGPRAGELERDPLSAWFKVATTLLEHGLLDGFQRGWRKVYVELLDAGAAPILAAILEVGGQAPLSAIEDLAWEQVASSYGYELDDAAERQQAVRLVRGMMTQFADIGAVSCRDGNVVLTGLGGALASAAAAMSADDEDLD